MREIKNIIHNFTSTEKRNFKKFLTSECADTLYPTFFNLLLRKDTKNKQDIYRLLYPNQVYRDGRLRSVIHRAKNILLQYIAIQSSSELDKRKSTHRYLKQYDVPQLLKTNLKKTGEIFPIEDDSFHFLLDYDIAEKTSGEIIQKGNRAIEPQLNESHKALDYYYFVEKLKLACNTANYSRISGYEYHLEFIDPVLDYLSKRNMDNTPLLYLYYHTYQMIATQREEDFERVYSYLQHHSIPENNDYREILLSCLNYCIQQINRGRHEYAAKTLEVYKLQISSKNIYHLQRLPSNTYKNIVILGLRLKEYVWTLDFIESEKSKLHSLHPIEDYQLVKARYHFELEEYDNCIRLIVQSRPTDILDSLQFRILQCKAYFELDEYDQVDSTIQNAKIYLLRHKSKAYQLRLYSHFFKLLQKIIRYNHTQSAKSNILKSYLETSPIAEKQWIKEQIDEL